MKLAACLIVRNEARDIAEWLAFHAVAGFDTFLVYDNGSIDGTRPLLRAAARLLDVRLILWPSDAGQAQVKAYAHAIATGRTEFDWIAFIDSDEYLVTHPPHTLRSLCAAAHDDVAALGVHWAVFGSNGHVQLPDGLLTEAFTRRAPNSFSPNRHIKTILRPGRARECLNPHAFALDGRITGPDGTTLVWLEAGGQHHVGITTDQPDFAVAQLNHYFTRSRAHWAMKTLRSYPNPSSRAKLGWFDEYDRNEIEDRSATRSSEAVRTLRARILAIAAQAVPRRLHPRPSLPELHPAGNAA